MPMKPVTKPRVYALKNTQVIENDKTLKRDAGRKTGIFVIIEIKPNSFPLAVI